MKIYISGAITGCQMNEVKEKFKRVEDLLSPFNNEIVNPLKITAHLKEGIEWQEYMKVCIIALMDCEKIFMIEGWQQSRGAKIEHRLAKDLGIKIINL